MQIGLFFFSLILLVSGKTYFERIETGKAHVPLTQNCHLNDSSCSLNAFQSNQVVSIYPGGRTRCLASSPYHFKVYPGRSDQLLLYFQGGGVCWNKYSALYPSLVCKMEAGDVEQKSFGVFDRQEELNPYRHYTIVHILYCSGDLHLGDARMQYSQITGHPVFHRGGANTAAVLNWIQAQEFNLEDLVIMGNSAGSIAAQFYSASILETLKYQRAAVVMDSYVVLEPEDRFYREMIRSMGVCRNKWIWGSNSTMQANCWTLKVTVDEILLETMRRFPKVTFAMVTSKLDSIQRAFYSVTRGTLTTDYGFYQRVNDRLRLYSTQAKNFVSYLVDGTTHCFTNWHELYHTFTFGLVTTSTRGDTNPSLISWLSRLPLKQGATIQSHCNGEYVVKQDITTEQCDAIAMRADVNQLEKYQPYSLPYYQDLDQDLDLFIPP